MEKSEETKKGTSKKEKELERIPKERKKLWSKLNNSVKVLLSGILSIILILLIYFYVIEGINKDSVGYWNFIILIVSSPVAFVIWQLRDENIRQQIENQRKDINLKEFQKLSEWVSGAHLPEIKIVNKKIEKSSTTDNESDTSPNIKTTEETKEYSKEYEQKPDTDHFDTFGKRDGAVALQISAIYNLLPFFRGDYGESFRLPALNLLKSAWQAMQQYELNELNELEELRKLNESNEINKLKELEELNKSKESEEFKNLISQEREKRRDNYIKQRKEIIRNLRQKAHNPMGVALTHVLLSSNRENTQLNLNDFPEIMSNLCLAGIDFNVKYNIINPLFINSTAFYLPRIDAPIPRVKLSRINLFGANLSYAILSNAILDNTNLSSTNLSHVILNNSNLYCADLSYADLSFANLSKSKLFGSTFYNSILYSTDLRGCFSYKTELRDYNFLYRDMLMLMMNEKCLYAKITITDFHMVIYPFLGGNSEWKNLTEPEQKETMQKFCNETGMIIFDNKENVIAKRQS